MQQYPLVNYTPISKDIQNSLSIYGQIMQALNAPEQMKMQQQMQNAKIAQMRSLTQGQDLQNQYYPQATQADINYKKAQVPYLGAQTAQTEEQTKLAPVNTAIAAQNSLTNAYQNQRMAQQRNWAWGLQRVLSAMPQGARDSWIADHQGEYNAMIQSIMQSGQQGSSNFPMVLTPDFLKQSGFPSQQQSQIMQQQSAQTGQQPSIPPSMIGAALQGAPSSQMQVNPNQLTPQQTQDIWKIIANNPTASQDEDNPLNLQNAIQGNSMTPEWINPETGAPQIVVGGQQPKFTPDQRQQVATMIAANRSSTGPQIQNRLMGAVALSNFMYDPEIQKELVTLSKYSGVEGKSEAWLKSHLKPEEMAEYNNAKNRLPVLISGSVKGIENLPTSTLGMQAGGDFLNISKNQEAWVNNPDATRKDWLAAYRAADAEERSILKTAQPLYEVYKLPENPPAIIQGALSKQSNVAQQLAEKTGLKAPASQKSAPIKVPSFDSQEEARAWYAKQSPEVKAQIRRQQGGQ